MNRTVSILHISDLHRAAKGDPSNAAILASLVSDRDNYTKNEERIVRPPDLVIVSGDIIQGSNDPANSEELIKSQYDEALLLLSEIAREFLGGEKQRIVIVPGNHDVDWKLSVESMSEIDSANIFDEGDTVKTKFLHGAINHRSKIRWNWKKLSFFEVTDDEKYQLRMAAFSEFYSNFYDGKRTFSLADNEQFEIFDYPDFNITVIGYNSCYCNDHLQFSGHIHPECIANSMMRIRDFRSRGRLIIATWHHNTRGLPYEVNYMDSSQLKNFIDAGVSLGFHGHQHKTEIIHEFSDVMSQKKIIVFSAGTLCAGPKELPVGNNRQYNIVEIYWDDGSPALEVTLHTREKSDTSPLDNPIWKPGRIDSNLISFHTMRIDKPIAQNINAELLDIEGLMKGALWEDAIERLLNLDLDDTFVRKYLLECFVQSNNATKALVAFNEPRNDEELVLTLQSSIEVNDKDSMRRLVQIARNVGSTDPTVIGLIKKINAILE